LISVQTPEAPGGFDERWLPLFAEIARSDATLKDEPCLAEHKAS